MSATRSPEFVLESRGVHRALHAFVVAACFDRAGLRAGFALGDGRVWTVDLADRQTWRETEAHDGAALALAADPIAGGFLSGGDDGRLIRLGADGSVSTLFSAGSKWIEHVASCVPDKGKGLIACAAGRQMHLLDEAGAILKTLEHPSTVAGICFDARGKRLGAAHYGGASLWFVNARIDTPRRLEWKGSHLDIAISPDGDAVVTTMQENALHGWRLSDGQHMRMSGYPGKTRSLSFSRNGKWLATSGADAIVLWPFTGGGPMGKQPLELAGGDGVTCTMVACHPQHDAVAAGFSDGLVLLVDIATQRVLPVVRPGRGPVSALAWSTGGGCLALGTESGFAALIDFSRS